MTVAFLRKILTKPYFYATLLTCMFLHSYEQIAGDIEKKGLSPDNYIIINDLKHCDEADLDYEKYIYINDCSRRTDVSTANIRFFFDILKSQGYDITHFFDNDTKYSFAYLNDYYQWIPMEDYYELVYRIIDFLGFNNANPRFAKKLGRIAAEQDKTMVNFFHLALKFINANTFFEYLPFFIRYFNSDLSGQYVTQDSMGAGRLKIVIILKNFDNYSEDIPIWTILFMNGIFEALPRRINRNYAESKIVYYQIGLKRMLERDYKHLNLKLVEKGASLFINGKEYARKVLLLKERIQCRYSFHTRFFSLFRRIFLRKKRLPAFKEIYSEKSIAVQDLGRAELDEKLAQKKGIVCYQVTDDFLIRESGFILRKGEVFGCPYSRIDFILDLKTVVKQEGIGTFSKNIDALNHHLFKLKSQIVDLENAKEIAEYEARAAEQAKTKLEELNATLESKVSERTAALEKANRQIEEASRQKTIFFVNLAHEIKTPLTLIINYLDRHIQKTGMTDELRVIRQNLDILKRDIINFLDSEKLVQGQIFYNHEQIINLSEMVTQKGKLFQEIASKKRISMLVSVEPSLHIKADPAAIDRVVNNLLDNAIKYTNETGTIEMHLKKNNGLHLIIKDNGRGIPEDRIHSIFEPFNQISGNNRNIHGIGMGLYIVKKILAAIDARIHVESRENCGTVFTILFYEHCLRMNDSVEKKIEYTLPVDTSSHLKPRQSEKREGAPVILIVEDNADLLFFIHSRLSEHYNVIIARDGNEAFEKLSNNPKPDLIISDIMMDKMDGYEFHDACAQHPLFRDVPFIFLTARSSLDEKIKAYSSGAVDYITKPFYIDELEFKIKALLRYQRIKRELYEKEKYATIGMLVSGISHEILNPLESVYAPIENLEDYLGRRKLGDEDTRGFFERIYKNLDRIGKMIRMLKVLYYEHKLKTDVIDVKQIVAAVLDYYEEKIRERIAVHFSCDDSVVISGNEEALFHIISNLIANSIDAIKDRGDIFINIIKKGGKPVIILKDTGCGINKEYMDDIFDPFFTTKQIGVGTGLGLYIAKHLILKQGWNIHVRSEPLKGSEFIIEIEK
ncbi:MAG: response regulator [Spirochaetales bacterium]|nr:response regulator [Spirochaetales bacterium]